METKQEKKKRLEKESQKRYYEKNKEIKIAKNRKWAEDHRDKMNEYYRKYRKKYPEKNRMYASIRRARLRNAMPAWINTNDILPIYKQAQLISKETGIPHDVDHIIPLKAVNKTGKHIACGLHVPWNLQVINATTNRKKLNKIQDEDIV